MFILVIYSKSCLIIIYMNLKTKFVFFVSKCDQKLEVHIKINRVVKCVMIKIILNHSIKQTYKLKIVFKGLENFLCVCCAGKLQNFILSLKKSIKIHNVCKLSTILSQFCKHKELNI